MTSSPMRARNEEEGFGASNGVFMDTLHSGCQPYAI